MGALLPEAAREGFLIFHGVTRMTFSLAERQLPFAPRFARRYTDPSKPWVAPPRRLAANDDEPPAAAQAMKARREIVGKITGAGRPVLAWPALARLKRRREEAAVNALRAWRDLMAPHRNMAANDNVARFDDGGEAGETKRLNIDSVTEIRPTAREMVAAGFRVSFTRTPDGDEIRSHSKDGGPCATVLNDVATIRLGGLRFDEAGRLMEWQASDSRWRKPVDRSRAAKGEAPPRRSTADFRRLVANDNVPIAAGAEFLAGVSRSSGTARPGAGVEADAIAEAERVALRERVRRLMPGNFVQVLDLAITDATAQEIGKTLGFSGKYAERVALKRMDEALKIFGEIVP